jgi:hypothetical protein
MDMFWRKKQAVMPHRDIHAEAALGISNAASVLPAGRFIALVYWAIITNRQISTEAIDDLANRLSRAAWERGRK